MPFRKMSVFLTIEGERFCFEAKAYNATNSQMNKVALEILGMSYSESQTGAYVLIMGDKNSQRRLPIVIGSNEAQSIAMGIERQKNSRPLTHDLFLNFALNFNINLKEVVINRFREGVFYAVLVCEQHGELSMIDARPSDAIALAVRCGCGIFAYESVMVEAGIIMDDENQVLDNEETDDTPIINSKEESLRQLSETELEDLLQAAIDEEDYAKAAAIRDELNSRK